ncbi:biotin carboxyl carrier protein [Variovorax beijingensis]|uniref:Biotin carboxyl carrier protein of acetyl-CoA carboxylase n=2 Tax=Variovorax TaxID=34072 RepID=A0AAE4BZ77_VARPD|nr:MULTISPECIES: acetyl-CoA carboxylase biotin carboxyl carrier protein subunit [Variovorax]MDP9964782.1 acetyl-CoA carboxylase biotin carboxyl carrier protein [Variovorax paradoxus]MDR6427682.1 acetyl-CoA carboxylase biotin carboxyl carrier protein [Variovorax paradoxus]MDR6454844.1 acetyl-CoA carboxylase biotin carboxyl carrier protein [Variovorax paradoxus]TWD76433.1 biotin carboxyl carrier protein [Variovorax beijingensis]
MKQEQIKTLIDALAASDLAELEYSEDGSTLRLVKQSALKGVPAVRRPAAARKAPAAVSAEPALPAAAAAECLAPLYGVVHLQPAPGEPPFVQPGQAVEAGQMLCVIEAMKMFNEVRADAAAIVQAVLVRSGQEVDAGQPLFRFG